MAVFTVTAHDSLDQPPFNMNLIFTGLAAVAQDHVQISANGNTAYVYYHPFVNGHVDFTTTYYIYYSGHDFTPAFGDAGVQGYVTGADLYLKDASGSLNLARLAITLGDGDGGPAFGTKGLGGIPVAASLDLTPDSLLRDAARFDKDGANLTITGDYLSDVLTGSNFADTIDGGGIDTINSGAKLIGYGGNDTYIVSQPTMTVIEARDGGNDTVQVKGSSYTLLPNQEIENLQAAAVGSTAALDLTGNDFAQTIVGNQGNNVIDGRGGVDRMLGLKGDDTYIVDNPNDVIAGEQAGGFFAGGGNDRVETSVSYTLPTSQPLELFTTTNAQGTSAINLTGNEFGQSIFGNAGNNVINGQGGADTMSGGLGNDQYFVDTAADVVLEAANSGSDRVLASVNYALRTGQSIELLTTTNSAATTAINFTGNEFGQSIFGNAGKNIIDGKGGADTMSGGVGDDQYFVDTAADVVLEAANGGSDRVLAGVSYTLRAGQSVELFTTTNASGTSAINLTGNELAQNIQGNNGANLINGKGGKDALTGLGGNDTFLFNVPLDATNNVARILDFAHGTDKVALENAVFTTLTTPGTLSANAFFIGAAAHDADDHVIYNAATGALIYDSNGNAAGGATQFATLAAGLALTNTDFIVV